MNFNKKRCLELLKERKSLQKEGNFLWNSEKAKSEELTRYLILFDDQIFWESRKKYCQILDLFVSKKISLDDFFTQFYGLWGSNLKAFRMWKENLEEESNEIDVQLNPESRGPDITSEMNLNGYGISEEFLRFTIKEDFLPQLAKYCKEF